MTTLDIIIPVHDEGNNVLAVLDTLRTSIKTQFNVLICYDYDEDSTLAALRTYPQPPFEIQLVKNARTGVHGAVVTGFEVSTAQAVLVFPADDTYNAGIIDIMVERFQAGCEIVAASRFMPGGKMRGCPWLKAFLVRSAAFTLYYLARVPTHDPSNGFRLFSRKVVSNVPIESTKGFTYSIELLVKCHRLGWKVCEVPALWFERTKGQGKSNFKVLKWLGAYLRWYFYAFATTYLHRR